MRHIYVIWCDCKIWCNQILLSDIVTFHRQSIVFEHLQDNFKNITYYKWHIQSSFRIFGHIYGYIQEENIQLEKLYYYIIMGLCIQYLGRCDHLHIRGWVVTFWKKSELWRRKDYGDAIPGLWQYEIVDSSCDDIHCLWETLCAASH